MIELPPKVDPAGENGEFHSFAFDEPIFKKRTEFTMRQAVHIDLFFFRFDI